MKSGALVPLTVVFLTYNEEQNLPKCLESVSGWVKEIFVVDSGSCDQTREIAIRRGAVVMDHSFETHAKQWKWALETLPITTEWILALDADQRITTDLKEEIIRLFTKDQDWLRDKEGFYVKRRQIFRGRWIRHGGYYPKYLLKMFRRDKVMIDMNDLVDHHFIVKGPTVKCQNDLIENNQKENDITFWIEKHIRYADLLAREDHLKRSDSPGEFLSPSPVGNPDQKTIWKKQVWKRFPLYVRPFFYFLYRYILRLGFLDGKEGFIFHFLHAFWFRLLVDIKLEDMKKAEEGLEGVKEKDGVDTGKKVERI